MKYTLDGVDYDDAPKVERPSRLELFLELFLDAVFSDVADIVDFLCSIPPLSWLDAALRGFVGPEK